MMPTVGGLELLGVQVMVDGLGLPEATVMVDESSGLPMVTAVPAHPFPRGFPREKKEGMIRETMTTIHRLPLHYLALQSASAKAEEWWLAGVVVVATAAKTGTVKAAVGKMPASPSQDQELAHHSAHYLLSPLFLIPRAPRVCHPPLPRPQTQARLEPPTAPQYRRLERQISALDTAS